MKLFMERTNIQKFDNVSEFVKEFKIGKEDFILVSKSLYEKYFKPLNLEATVICKNKYGTGEPTDIMMDMLLEDFNNSNCNRIIAIGGGAVIDMAKILVLKDGKSAEDIFTKRIPFEKIRPLIAIPTTCGAGSEVSNISVTEMTKMGTKLGIATDELYPDYAVLIPELITDLPYKFFATSAIDALIHAIESYMAPSANVYTEVFSKQAMEMIIDGFKIIAKDGKEARFNMLDRFLTASNLAGVAFSNASNGAVHAMSYPLSGCYHVPHGESNYLFFTAVFKEYMVKNSTGKISSLNKILSNILDCDADNVYEKMEELLDKIIERKKLREYGMIEDDIESFASSIVKNQQRLLSQGYVQFSQEELANIYRRLY
ncbi:iron-containing alcohol dehydrogenase [Romboutsia weinsteinii]|uniref:Iron-containing alcohol dehydrogenase n=1 Tax=Romboutsia weinsteinii TaxID=2020949 RepID=A0A371J3B3_9FIRM|nr:4-hydroxybutyrate dehydrogenase [Romboutsia weinsteinii]RDY27269.1 iron-containing alcohol dehydrogenase [Romboutsia weinsteinii]